MNLDYLFDHVMHHHKPLDWDKVGNIVEGSCSIVRCLIQWLDP
jgi:hypothetical protein